MKLFRPFTCLASLTLMLLSIGCATSNQATYHSPGAAVDALVSAARAHDRQEITRIFGDDLSSGDEIADRNNVDRFVKAYDQHHEMVEAEDGYMTLIVGDSYWPLPIPIAPNGDGSVWKFDTQAGKEEILNRRIGRNEKDAIRVCLAIADAEFEYAQLDTDGDGIPNYAQKLLSDEGKQNGLYWPTAEGEPQSPAGQAVANAANEGYKRSTTGEQIPYHGYYYRVLTEQGPNAPGGAYDYMANGKMIGGFAVVASPAEYDNSGVMTFMVSHDGVVYEKDLGGQTNSIAQSMKSFDPDESWSKVDVDSLED